MHSVEYPKHSQTHGMRVNGHLQPQKRAHQRQLIRTPTERFVTFLGDAGVVGVEVSHQSVVDRSHSQHNSTQTPIQVDSVPHPTVIEVPWTLLMILSDPLLHPAPVSVYVHRSSSAVEVLALGNALIVPSMPLWCGISNIPKKELDPHALTRETESDRRRRSTGKHFHGWHS